MSGAGSLPGNGRSIRSFPSNAIPVIDVRFALIVRQIPLVYSAGLFDQPFAYNCMFVAILQRQARLA